jgi:alkaline phosphatase
MECWRELRLYLSVNKISSVHTAETVHSQFGRKKMYSGTSLQRVFKWSGPVLLVAMSLVFAQAGPNGNKMPVNKNFAKNIIFMVPDGMGLADVTAARIFKNGPDGAPLAFETLPIIGYQRTHSENSTVTDSAAAASAWACGEKFLNGEICLHDRNGDSAEDLDSPAPLTILEIAKALGKTTGLVATSDITHATPASFGAHVHNRKCEYEIARQYIYETEVEVLLGGGIAKNRSSCGLPHSDDDDVPDLIDSAPGAGYVVVEDEIGLDTAVASGAEKILGLFRSGGKSVEMFRVDPGTPYPAGEPTLAEMTKAALDVLEEGPNGFFLMVEGSQIDWENHGNSISGQIAETLAFDEAVTEVLNWVNAHSARQAHTLVVVVPDHETGGFAINGPYGELSIPGDIVADGWTTGGHSATDVLIWSQGPGAELFGRALDNTDLYYLMLDVLR